MKEGNNKRNDGQECVKFTIIKYIIIQVDITLILITYKWTKFSNQMTKIVIIG